MRVGDVTRLSGVPGPFDLILDIGCFHGLPPAGQMAYAHNVKRLLAGDGTFLLYVMFKDALRSGRSGVAESDLLRFQPELHLVTRIDSVDAVRDRPAAWLTYKKASSGLRDF